MFHLLLISGWNIFIQLDGSGFLLVAIPRSEFQADLNPTALLLHYEMVIYFERNASKELSYGVQIHYN